MSCLCCAGAVYVCMYVMMLLCGHMLCDQGILFWDKANLEPYSPSKDVYFVVVTNNNSNNNNNSWNTTNYKYESNKNTSDYDNCKENTRCLQFFKELTSMYEVYVLIISTRYIHTLYKRL